jgi:hypothetical protein
VAAIVACHTEVINSYYIGIFGISGWSLAHWGVAVNYEELCKIAGEMFNFK